jgi:hypothetical protein
MKKQVRQRLNILIVLVVVFALTLVLGYRMNQPPSTAAVQTGETKSSPTAPAASDARIRLDLVEKPEASQDIGRHNVFQYSRPAAPPAVPEESRLNPPARPNLPPPPVARPPGPTGPPPPPPIPLKYQGFAVVNSGTGSFMAFLTDETQKHYNVTVGEVLLGRFRITRISDNAVEVEDLEYNRRQTLPLVK